MHKKKSPPEDSARKWPFEKQDESSWGETKHPNISILNLLNCEKQTCDIFVVASLVT